MLLSVRPSVHTSEHASVRPSMHPSIHIFIKMNNGNYLGEELVRKWFLGETTRVLGETTRVGNRDETTSGKRLGAKRLVTKMVIGRNDQ